MTRLSLAAASKHLRMESGNPVTLVHWDCSRVEDDDVLFVIYSYIQRYPQDPDLKPHKQYRWCIFVNQSATAGGHIDA